MAAKNKPNELHLTRVYNAPVKLVWDAWTDPKQVAQWWGPRGFTITTKKKDVRTGGSWVYTMHGPDGTDWPNHTIYHEVEKYQRMVYDHGGNENQPPLFRVTVTFKELKGNKTKMEMTMAMPSAEALAETRKIIKSAGGNTTWDRLAEFLEKETTGKEKFVINHSFEAPVETLFDMWANPEHLKNWLGPTGSTTDFMKGEIRTGGSIFYAMTFQGATMHGKIHYIDVTRPDRMVYEQVFTDANGNLSRHPFAPTWPEKMLTKVTFVPEENGSRVTVEWEPTGDVSREEMETFIKERAGMSQGWDGSFDRLEEYLVTRSK